MTGDTALGPGREFDLVRALLRRWGSTARGVGDDAAVLDVPPGEHLVASTDTAVENVHFRRDWLTPREIGWRAMAAALSDLAAMGAAPLGALIALSLPPDWLPQVEELADGLGDAARAAGCPIVGGDLARSRELSIGITALGHAAQVLPRAGARAGEALWLTGALGGPGAAVAAWTRGEEPRPEHRERFAHPEPRIAAGRWLAAHGATAAIDVSDGLLGDAEHVAAASGARLEIDLDAVPCVAGVSPEDAARSGEEYELLVAAPAALDAAAFARDVGLSLTRVGRVEQGAPEVRATLGGRRVAPGGGFDHFS